MKSDLSLQQVTRSISHFMHRYHVIIFAIFVVGGLSVATFLLYQVTSVAAVPSAKTSSANFDKATIDRISKLRGANDTSEPLNLPQGRTNPFQD